MKEDWSGNQVRDLLRVAGIPNPNKKLIDTVAPAVLTDEKGGTLRRWQYARAEVLPIVAELSADFLELDGLSYGDSGMFNARRDEISEKFYKRLSKIEKL